MRFAPCLNIAFFFLAILATSGLLAQFSPFPKLGNLTRKYHHLAQKSDAYSLIYIGSSRVYHEFIPAKFDAALAESGHSIRSFNFGQDGMWPPESLYMLRKILALRPAGLRWVFIDLSLIQPKLKGNENTLRGLYWHDASHTWIAIRHIAGASNMSISEKTKEIWHHTKLFTQRATHLGEGAERIEILFRLKRDKAPGNVPDEGFEVGGSGPLAGAERKEFLTEVATLKYHKKPKPIPVPLRDALEKSAQEVRAIGAEPVFIVPASIYGDERFSDWPPQDIKIMAFDDPEKYPQLYNPDMRYDPHHLDHRGALEFTAALAKRFAEILSSPR